MDQLMHRTAAPVDSVRHKIRSLTTQLEQFQLEICAELSVAEASPNGARLRNAAAEDLAELRASLDQLRRVLWFYLEENVTREPVERLTAQASRQGHIDPPPSFFDRLNLVIEGYMQTRSGFEVLKRKSPATDSWKDDGPGWQSSIRSRTQAG
jgi:hypothetical protein